MRDRKIEAPRERATGFAVSSLEPTVGFRSAGFRSAGLGQPGQSRSLARPAQSHAPGDPAPTVARAEPYLLG